MCSECWEQAGCPQIANEKVRECIKLIDEVYNHNAVGGGLHVVLDDFNVDGDMQWESEWVETHRDSPEQYEAERACCDLLMTMTEAERMSAVSCYHGYWPLDGPEPFVEVKTYSLWRGKEWNLLPGTDPDGDDDSATIVKTFRAFNPNDAISVAKRMAGVV